MKTGFKLDFSPFLQMGWIEEDEWLVTPLGGYIRMNYTSNYELGYIFGAYMMAGYANLTYVRNKTSRIGLLWWLLTKDTYDSHVKLMRCISVCFGKNAKLFHKVAPRVILYSKPIAEFFGYFFGSAKKKRFPREFIVDNDEYLFGVYEGMIDFMRPSPNEDTTRLLQFLKVRLRKYDI